MGENALAKATRAAALRWGWLPIRLAYMTIRGYPDWLFLRHGRFVFMELKDKDKEPTRQQTRRHEELRRYGAEVYWYDCLDDIVLVLRSAA